MAPRPSSLAAGMSWRSPLVARRSRHVPPADCGVLAQCCDSAGMLATWSPRLRATLATQIRRIAAAEARSCDLRGPGGRSLPDTTLARSAIVSVGAMRGIKGGGHMRQREFITLLGGAAAWPVAARAQQAMPVVGFVGGTADPANLAAFRKGLNEAGYIDGQNVAVEYHWLEGQYDRVPALMADLVSRRVAVIATRASTPVSLAAKAATATIPVVFGVGDDPVNLGLVASLARPGGNVTGINFFTLEVVAKRLRLLHDLLPKAARVAVLINPASATAAEATLQQVQEAAPALGLQIQVFNAQTIGEIEATFAVMAHERPDALFLAADAFFVSRRVQFATLTAVNKIPACYGYRAYVAAGGLMSYAADIADSFRQVGAYTGRVLMGAKPADLPIVQSTKFGLVINLQTARALAIEVPPTLLAIADEVIE
jgi:putative ABC transport system substrate-binding protein